MAFHSVAGGAAVCGRVSILRRRYYIFIVTHDWDGQLRRIPIPVQWVVLFVAFAAIGALTLAGLAGSYGRMLSKMQNFNEMRQRQEVLATQLLSARKDADQFRAEVASLGSLASEVSSLYNFKHNASLKDRIKDSAPDAGDADLAAGAAPDPLSLYDATLNNFQVLETTALQNTLPHGAWSPFGDGIWRPSLWPVGGHITSSFGQRLNPLQSDGEGEFHAGIDIGASYGTPVHVTADGVVVFSGYENGYGRTVIVEHGHGMRTLYGHLSGMTVTFGQHILRDEVLGYVGMSGLTTGAHLHYEVHINGAAVNPYPYLH